MFEIQKIYKFYHCTDSTIHTPFIDALQQLGIDVKDYPEHKMWLLDYNQITCIKNHPVVNECRGLLMGYDGTIIRKGFDRFYNLGENGVSEFDFENSVAFEKADGSLMFVYWCPPTNRWEIGTRGTAFAEGPNEFHGTFRKFMLSAMGRSEDQFQLDCFGMDRGVTRLYEATGPDNRIVTPYKENGLVALSYVNNKTGEEVVAPAATFEKKACGWNVREVRQYKFNTKEDCMIALAELTGLEEGYVVRNTKTGERVKIKNAVYLAAHRLRGNGLTKNSIFELVAMGEVDEYLATFPEDTEKFNDALIQFAAMKNELFILYEEYKGIDNQKEFALKVKDSRLSCVMFKAKKNGTAVMAEFNLFPVNKRAEWIKEMLV